MSKMATALLDVIRQMDPNEARVLLTAADLAISQHRAGPFDHGNGSPRDAAVQAYAGLYMRLHRDPFFRNLWLQKLGDKQTTYEKLGEEAGVSRERARQLYEQLCPEQHVLERRAG